MAGPRVVLPSNLTSPTTSPRVFIPATPATVLPSLLINPGTLEVIGTLANEASLGIINVRIGQLAGTPRIYLDNGSTLWEIDNSAGVLRLLTPGQVKATLDTTGALVLTGPLSMPPNSGGTVASTQYGTVPVKLTDVLFASPGGNITFSSIPQTFRSLHVEGYARTTDAVTVVAVGVVFNGDTGAHYGWQEITATGNSVTASDNNNAGDTQGLIGDVPANNAPANVFGMFDLVVVNYSSSTTTITSIGRSIDQEAAIAHGSMRIRQAGTCWVPAAFAAVTSLAITDRSGGNFQTGTYFKLSADP